MNKGIMVNTSLEIPAWLIEWKRLREKKKDERPCLELPVPMSDDREGSLDMEPEKVEDDVILIKLL